MIGEGRDRQCFKRHHVCTVPHLFHVAAHQFPRQYPCVLCPFCPRFMSSPVEMRAHHLGNCSSRKRKCSSPRGGSIGLQRLRMLLPGRPLVNPSQYFFREHRAVLQPRGSLSEKLRPLNQARSAARKSLLDNDRVRRLHFVIWRNNLVRRTDARSACHNQRPGT